MNNNDIDTTAYCMKCGAEDLSTGMICRRPGAPFIDNGADHDADICRYEGICLRCCDHNHG